MPLLTSAEQNDTESATSAHSTARFDSPLTGLKGLGNPSKQQQHLSEQLLYKQLLFHKHLSLEYKVF